MRKCKGHCRGLLPYITDYLEGDAAESICERIERHMVGCEKCRMYVDTHGRIIELYEKWRDEDMPTGAKARLQKRLSAEMTAKQPQRTTKQPRRRSR